VALGIGAVVALRTGGHADLQYEPALVEVLGGYTLSCLHRPGRGPTRHGRRRPLAVTRLSPAAVALVLIGAGLVALRPDSPPAALSSPPVLVSIGVTPGDLLPAGWRLVGTEVNAWPPAYFGIGASFVRYLLAPPANSGMHEAAVDVTTGPDLAPFLVFPTIYTYAYASPVSVSTRPVLPGRGIVAALDYTNSSELTSADSGEWAMESILWRVEVGGYYERVAVSSLAGSGSGILPVPAAPFRNGSFRAVLANILRGQPPVATGSPPPRAVATVGRLVAHLVAAQQVIER
jgi:hypothetical protein